MRISECSKKEYRATKESRPHHIRRMPSATVPQVKKMRLSLKQKRKDATLCMNEPSEGKGGATEQYDTEPQTNDINTTVEESKITEKEDAPGALENGSGDSEPPPCVAGLANLGNTCFLNSVIQVLRYSPGVPEAISVLARDVRAMSKAKLAKAKSEKVDQSGSGDVSLQAQLVESLNKMFQRMENTENKYRHGEAQLYVSKPKKILEIISELNPMFEGNEQHDAQELLNCLLYYIQDTCSQLQQHMNGGNDDTATNSQDDENKEDKPDTIFHLGDEEITHCEEDKLEHQKPEESPLKTAAGDSTSLDQVEHKTPTKTESDSESKTPVTPKADGETATTNADNVMSENGTNLLPKDGTPIKVHVQIESPRRFTSMSKMPKITPSPSKCKKLKLCEVLNEDVTKDKIPDSDITLRDCHMEVTTANTKAVTGGVTILEKYAKSPKSVLSPSNSHVNTSRTGVISSKNDISSPEKEVKSFNNDVKIPNDDVKDIKCDGNTSKDTNHEENDTKETNDENNAIDSESTIDNSRRPKRKRSQKSGNDSNESATKSKKTESKRKSNGKNDATQTSLLSMWKQPQMKRYGMTGGIVKQETCNSPVCKLKQPVLKLDKCDRPILPVLKLEKCDGPNSPHRMHCDTLSPASDVKIKLFDSRPEPKRENRKIKPATVKLEKLDERSLSPVLNLETSKLKCESSPKCETMKCESPVKNVKQEYESFENSNSSGCEETPKLQEQLLDNKTKKKTEEKIDIKTELKSPTAKINNKEINNNAVKTSEMDEKENQPTASENENRQMPNNIKITNNIQKLFSIFKNIGKKKEIMYRNTVKTLFEGKMGLSTVCLECERSTEREEEFQDISVAVKRDVQKVQTVEENVAEGYKSDDDEDDTSDATGWILSRLSEVDGLTGDNKYYCEACLRLVEGQRRMKYKTLPQLLMLHLKRFAANSGFLGGITKISDFAPTPLMLPCFQTACPQPCSKQGHRYELYGIVTHTGCTLSSGHYIAYVKANKSNFPPPTPSPPSRIREQSSRISHRKLTPKGETQKLQDKSNAQVTEGVTMDVDYTGKWFECDDEYITVLTETELEDKLLTKQAKDYGSPYMLFYNRAAEMK
ncbi:unnamed protein product [Owenia fusiformis]|uniref:Uncharacterized protein n=1 Tax=Owenia fusiformis TaxID=6347 RepID=A0A8J1TB17_OWEFU|nr:unnamed protein product [Owenia fusiformis]